MITCPSCGAENPADKRFCGDGGSALLAEAREIFERLGAMPILEQLAALQSHGTAVSA